MKQLFRPGLLLAGICILLLSFTSKPGGEGFEIYLNNKVLLQQFGSQMDEVKKIRLGNRSAGDQLSVKYHHCGKAGKNRTITIRDARDKLLKEWRFADVRDAYASMNCGVQDIANLQKMTSGVYKLYYASSELPKGRLLAYLEIAGPVNTQP